MFSHKDYREATDLLRQAKEVLESYATKKRLHWAEKTIGELYGYTDHNQTEIARTIMADTNTGVEETYGVIESAIIILRYPHDPQQIEQEE